MIYLKKKTTPPHPHLLGTGNTILNDRAQLFYSDWSATNVYIHPNSSKSHISILLVKLLALSIVIVLIRFHFLF
jgi:hypothetical protein